MTYEKDLYDFRHIIKNSVLKETDPDPIFAYMLPDVQRKHKDNTDMR